MWNNRRNKSWHSFSSFCFFPLSPPHPPAPPTPSPRRLLRFPLCLTCSVLFFFIYLPFFPWSCCGIVSLCVDWLCKCSYYACVSSPGGTVLPSPSLSLFPSLGCLSKSLPQRMRSFLRTTPLRRPPHISGAPGEENVAFLRGATQTEQSLQESGEEKKQTAN